MALPLSRQKSLPWHPDSRPRHFQRVGCFAKRPAGRTVAVSVALRHRFDSRSLHRSFAVRFAQKNTRDLSRGYSLEGTEKILPPGSPYSSHGSPLRTPMSSGHGSPQDSPHVARHRRDSEHSSGAVSRRGSSDVVSPLPEGHPLGSPDGRGRRRSDYSPHQGRSIHDVRRQKNIRLRGGETTRPRPRRSDSDGYKCGGKL